MSTITKEWLQKAISQHESMRDEIPFGLDEDDSNTLAALRIALAALEAEPVGFIARHKETGKFGSYLHPKEDWFKGSDYQVLSAYTSPPAPVSVPDAATAIRACMEEFPESVHDIVEECATIAENACHAAMLQGVAGNSPLIPDGGEHGFCHKHPDTRRLTHPYIQLMTYPPRPSIYCPKCDPNVTEWVEMDKKLRIDN